MIISNSNSFSVIRITIQSNKPQPKKKLEQDNQYCKRNRIPHANQSDVDKQKTYHTLEDYIDLYLCIDGRPAFQEGKKADFSWQHSASSSSICSFAQVKISGINSYLSVKTLGIKLHPWNYIIAYKRENKRPNPCPNFYRNFSLLQPPMKEDAESITRSAVCRL
jgi:hypothetical protein